jgi:lysophospholipase L1-like esterase
MRVLVFGDSIAQGFYDSEGGWANRLAAHYFKKSIDGKNEKNLTVFNLSISGDATPQLLRRFDAESSARIWPGEDFIFIFSVGINDSVVENGKVRVEQEDYSDNLRSLVQKARKFSNNILLVGLNACDEKITQPVAWNKAIHYTNKQISIYESIIRKISTEEGAQFLPLYEVFEEKKKHGEKLLFDGLHPNSEGHLIIYELVQEVLESW